MLRETRESAASDGLQRVAEHADKILKIIAAGKSISVVCEPGSFCTEQFVKNIKEKCGAVEIHAEEISAISMVARGCVHISSNDEFTIAEGQLTKLTDYEIELKTKDMESKFTIGETIHAELKREKVAVGDVIRVYKDSGFVERIGRAQFYENCGQLEGLVELPIGDCIKKEMIRTNITLSQLDAINCKRKDLEGFYATKLVPASVREDVDLQVNRWLKEKKIEVETKPILIRNSEILSASNLNTLNDLSRTYKLVYIFLCGKSVELGTLRTHIDNTTAEEAQKQIIKHLKSKKIKIEKSAQDKILYQITGENLQSAIDFIDLLRKGDAITSTDIDRFLSFTVL